MASRPIYYEDPYRTSLTARVVEVRADGLVLDQTICYPEGGGQGGDRGTIAACALLDTTKAKDGAIIHHIEKNTLAEGDEVEILLDWQRRYHFMRLHTAQHMASGILHQEFGIPTVSVHLGERIMMIECDREEVSRETAYQVEDAVNRRIAENRAVDAQIHGRASAEALGLRRSIKVGGDSIRLVTVEGVDTIACGGLHVAHTGEIGRFLYMGQEKIRGHVRLIYTVGEVATEEIRLRSEAVEALGSLFSAPVEELVEVAAHALHAAQAERSELARVQARLASLLLATLVESGRDVLTWQIDEAVGLKEIGQATSEYGDLLLCAVKAEEGGRFVWLIAAKGSAATRFDFNQNRSALFEGFEAKGGGRGGLFQGSGVGFGRDFLARFRELVN